MTIQILVLALETILISMIGGVIVLHSIAWKKSPKGIALMPMHVVVISFSQICFVVVAADLVPTDSWTSWQLIVYLLGSLLTAAALVIIGEFQRRRIIGQELHKLREERKYRDSATS